MALCLTGKQIKGMDAQVRDHKRDARLAASLESKLAAQKAVRALEAKRSELRRSIFELQDQIDARREALIAEMEGRLAQSVSDRALFAIRWRLV